MFLLSSRYEGYGKVLLEAALHSCPIVCSNVGVAPELMGSFSETFLFNQEDWQKAAKAIETSIEDESLRRAYVSSLESVAKELNYGNSKEVYLKKLYASYPQ